jgi:hypothetical protein
VQTGWAILLATLVVAGVLVGLNAAPRHAQDYALEMRHYDSKLAEGGNYDETFIVDAVHGAYNASDLSVTLDGKAWNVTWSTMGPVGPGTTFTFYAEAYDFLRTLQVLHGDEVLWSGKYGPGAGTPVTSTPG